MLLPKTVASGFVSPCIPTRSARPPAGPDRVHEIKHDGYRLQVRREGDAVRLFTRRGYDWTGRFPAIGAPRCCCALGYSRSMARRRYVARTASPSSTRYTGAAPSPRPCCDLLELDGEDLRSLPLRDRQKRLARLVGRRTLGIVVSTHTADDGAMIFRHACAMGLEGIVSKRLSAPYRSGPSRDWVKVKNPNSPAMVRHREDRW
jgi:bifunctional non-homologous end joining protein LigD